MTVPRKVKLIRHIGDLDDDGHDIYASPTLALDDLTDVVITSAAVSQRLRYDGASWVNVYTRDEPTFDSTGSALLDGHGDPLMIEVHS